MVRLTSINIRGLGDESKRIRVFKQLMQSAYDVIAIQETHCTPENVIKWKNEWPGISHWTGGSSNSAGLAFLFHPKHTVHIKDSFEAIPGRILRLTVKLNDTHLQLINVYGYNTRNTSKADIENFFYVLNQSFAYDPLPIIFGDFNMVESASMDRLGGTIRPYHTHGSTILQEIKDSSDLIDIWRELHTNTRGFTYSNHDGSIKSRIDRIYLPVMLKDVVSNACIMPTQLSDHDFLVVNVKLPDEIIRGKGKWSFNVDYLQHEAFNNRIIQFWREWRGRKSDYSDIRDWYDLGKVHLKSIAIQHAADLHETTKCLFRDLRTKLAEALNSECPDKVEIARLRDEIATLEDEKAQKVFILTQTALRDSGEKPTKYFYSILRKRTQQNTMSSLKTEDGRILKNTTDMLNEAKTFYTDLLTPPFSAVH